MNIDEDIIESPSPSPVNRKIPTGRYCYGYLPKQNTGLKTMAQLDAYISTLPEDQRSSAHWRLQHPVYCPHFQMMSHGRVRCKLLNRVAVRWSRRSEKLADALYRKHPKARERNKGFFIGDAVKECDFNRDGEDFSFFEEAMSPPSSAPTPSA